MTSQTPTAIPDQETGSDRAPRGHAEVASILLGSGGYFDFDHPEVSEITIEDIAYGLAYACRFAGQCWSPHLGRRVFYSVAEHCVRMSDLVPPALAFDALMHELGEGPCGDTVGPLKRRCPDFTHFEKSAERTLLIRFGVQMADKATIKHFDLRMLASERRDLMRWNGEPWALLEGIEPLDEIIIPWDAETAALRFLDRYHALSSG
jgi:hypothetical protein